MTGQRSSRHLTAAAAVAAVAVSVSACGGGSTSSSSSGSSSTSGAPATKLAVVTTINAWGGIAAQLGGDRVQETSIITNPDTDPHDYEPSPNDARTVADAKVFIDNGIGYDSWADKLLATSPNSGRTVVTVGGVVGVGDGGNPHQWYSPDSVAKVVDSITAAY